MDITEKRLSRREIYRGRVLNMFVDTVRLPNGKEAERELCEHIGAVAIVAVTDDGRVVMEKQYRHPHERIFLEIPAGKLDSKNEDHLLAAKRELREETGAVADEMIYIGEIDTTPALMDERIFLYLAKGLRFGERELDEDEFIEVELIPIEELVGMVMSGEIKDAKSAIGILKAARILGI